MRRHLIVCAALALAAACGDTTGSNESATRLLRSRDVLPAIDVRVSATRSVVSPGDSIDLIATATNHGAQRVQIGMDCGPSFDVLVRYPDANEHSALLDWIGPNGAFACPLTPSHFADPGETETFRLPWRAPATRGQYVVQAALRRGDGLGNFSPVLRLTVR